MEDEKRKYLRFECLVPVEFVRVEGAEDGMEHSQALLDEISREGIRVVMKMDPNFDPGTEVDLKVDIPERRMTTRVCGEVIWVKPKGKLFELGLRIKEMDKTTKSELLDLGYRQWREAEDKKK